MKKSITISRSKTFIKTVLLPLLFAFLFIQCTDEHVDPPEGENLIKSLLENNWSIDNTSSFVGEHALDVTTWTVKFDTTDNNTVSFEFGGDFATYLNGGSISVAEDGTISEESILAHEILAVSSAVCCCDKPYACFALEVSATPSQIDEGGVGTYNIVFVK